MLGSESSGGYDIWGRSDIAYPLIAYPSVSKGLENSRIAAESHQELGFPQYVLISR